MAHDGTGDHEGHQIRFKGRLARFWLSQLQIAISLPAGQGLAECEGVMTASKGKVIHLYQRDPQEALARLNRITGLRFSSWPQSLVNTATPSGEPSAAALPEAPSGKTPSGVVSG